MDWITCFLTQWMGDALPIAVAVSVMATHTTLTSIIDAQHEVLA